MMVGFVLYQDCVMKQIIFVFCNYLFININIWMFDSQWLVFDVCFFGVLFIGEIIECVNIYIGEVEVIYCVLQGVYVGVVIVYLKLEKYVFIYGLENFDEIWYYDFYYWCGVIVEGGKMSNFDVMDIIVLYMSGVLCGGSYVYVFSLNGERVSFIYNDYVMYEFDLVLDL